METNSVHIDIPAKRWTRNRPPKRILAIRLQAMGDMAAALPYLQDLRNTFPPPTRLDFLTRKEVEDIPRSLDLFDKVISIGGGRNFKKQLISTCFLLPGLMMRRYEVVIDMQNNILTEIIRKALMPKAWSVFDRFSPIPGGESYRLTIEATGIAKNKAENRFQLKHPGIGELILKANGWNGYDDLLILNPAAAFETRSWPIENYVTYAKLWQERFPNTKFLVIGTNFISTKAKQLEMHLGDKLINLVDKTRPSEAFAILPLVKFILSEDSGLMHMAWGSGVPTMGLFGGTKTDRVRPLGEHTSFLDSSDLPCGGCMLEICKYGDVHCLTRYSAQQVFDESIALLKKLKKISS